jgi:3-phosphoshikimate 1-carboxyvinyltransferase
MKKLIDLMEAFGATFLPKNKFKFPLTMISSGMPIGISYNAGVSAQLKSAVMLAGLNSCGVTTITENYKSRDHTENMLLKNRKSIKIKNRRKKIIKIFGKRNLYPIKINVPNDPSSAAFFFSTSLT